MSDEQFSDDDDASWKVRRGAAKLLAAVYANYAADLDALYPKTVPALLARFREREENVKADVFAAFIALLQQVSSCRGPPMAINAARLKWCHSVRGSQLILAIGGCTCLTFLAS